MQNTCRSCNVLTLGLALALCALISFPVRMMAEPQQRYQMGLSDDGIYRVTYLALHQTGLKGTPALDSLSLSAQGIAVRFWVDSPDDEFFGPGDSIEFVGHHRPGIDSYHNDDSRWNVYLLTVGQGPGTKFRGPLRGVTQRHPVRRIWRQEKDRLRVRFKRHFAEQEKPDLWYWHRLSPLDKKPATISLPDLDHRFLDDTRVTLYFRGWSRPKTDAETFDHQVEVVNQGQVLAKGQWNKQYAHSVKINGLPTTSRQPGILELHVPDRLQSADNAIVDVSLLDWVEIDQPFDGRLPSGLIHLKVTETTLLEVAAQKAGRYIIVDALGHRSSVDLGPDLTAHISLSNGEALAVSTERMATPAWIQADQPSDLSDRSQQADYLMISHHSLKSHVQPLATFHEERGLTVEIIDVQDIYDEFSNGLVSPQAIRDFIKYAYNHWQRPAPRFVLMVGDASWDVSNETPNFRRYADWTFRPWEKKGFVNNRSTPYKVEAFRNLIPAWEVDTFEGLAASDNAYVAIDGDDFYPDLAIGRLPVVDPFDVQSIVRKTIDYGTKTEIGPWRRKILWITNDQPSFQRVSNDLNQRLRLTGLAAEKIYPAAQDKDNSTHQSKLSRILNDGSLIVHFFGHGGRYIWRTGPPDIDKNHDLFTLDHIDALTPNSRLPLILSMTCYSAPFDHPTADSIGEKFLRAADKGGIGVFAASWRNRPAPAYSEELIRQLAKPGTTIGEAINRAKRSTKKKILVETYNYLGDPALKLAFPARKISIAVADDLRILANLDPSFGNDQIVGEAIADWLDHEGNVIESSGFPVTGRNFYIPRAKRVNPNQAAFLQLYFWNSELAIDAIGTLDLSMPAAG